MQLGRVAKRQTSTLSSLEPSDAPALPFLQNAQLTRIPQSGRVAKRPASALTRIPQSGRVAKRPASTTHPAIKSISRVKPDILQCGPTTSRAGASLGSSIEVERMCRSATLPDCGIPGSCSSVRPGIELLVKSSRARRLRSASIALAVSVWTDVPFCADASLRDDALPWTSHDLHPFFGRLMV